MATANTLHPAMTTAACTRIAGAKARIAIQQVPGPVDEFVR